MKKIGIITGAGLPSSIDEIFDSTMNIDKTHNSLGIFPSYTIAQKNNTQFTVMKRHGADAHGNPLISPADMVTNKVYEGMIYELTQLQGVESIFAFSRVGHVDTNLKLVGDGGIIVPNQYIPGSASQHSFGSKYAKTIHPGMGNPFNEELRRILIQSGEEIGAEVFKQGTYFYHAGDAFETKAEIEDIRQKDYLLNKIVGMTVVPEVILSAQMNTPYAVMCFSVNPAEGLSKTIMVSHEQTNAEMTRGEKLVEDVYRHIIQTLSK